MGKRSTITGYWRQRGATASSSSSSTGPTPAVMTSVLRISFDPTAATAAQGVTIPAGARVIGLQTDGGGTGGISPTIDIGTATDDDAFGAEVPADSAQNLTIGATTAGVSFGTILASDEEVWAGVGASAATGGTVVALIHWIMDDDGSIND